LRLRRISIGNRQRSAWAGDGARAGVDAGAYRQGRPRRRSTAHRRQPPPTQHAAPTRGVSRILSPPDGRQPVPGGASEPCPGGKGTGESTSGWATARRAASNSDPGERHTEPWASRDRRRADGTSGPTSRREEAGCSLSVSRREALAPGHAGRATSTTKQYKRTAPSAAGVRRERNASQLSARQGRNKRVSVRASRTVGGSATRRAGQQRCGARNAARLILSFAIERDSDQQKKKTDRNVPRRESTPSSEAGQNGARIRSPPNASARAARQHERGKLNEHSTARTLPGPTVPEGCAQPHPTRSRGRSA
jgi:hypothetical protein